MVHFLFDNPHTSDIFDAVFKENQQHFIECAFDSCNIRMLDILSQNGLALDMEYLHDDHLVVNLVGLAALSGKKLMLEYAINLYNDCTAIEYIARNHDARVGLHPYNGCTPLMLAVCAGNLDCARLLVQKGANTFVKNPFGYNLLHLAAMAKSKETFDFLLENTEIDADEQNMDGQSAKKLYRKKF